MVPEEKRATLNNDKITEKNKDNAPIQTERKVKAHFAPWIASHALQDSVEVMPQNLSEKEPMTQSSSMGQTQKNFQETISQTNNTATNDLISGQLTKEKRSDHQERAKQHPQKAIVYWDTTTRKTETASLPSSEKLSLSPETKEERTAEQIQTLKKGDVLSFTVSRPQYQQKMLIPAEKISSLTNEEIITRIKSNASLQERRTEIETLCQIIYGNRHILQEKIERIHKNRTEGEQLTYQIATSPQSITKFAGSNIFGIKNNARTNAEANIMPLCRAIECYINIFTQTERDILHDHHAKQRRCEQAVEMPKVWMQNLLSLPKEQQQETLSNSPELRGELRNYIRKINERLSSSEHEAIKENNPEKLAKSLGTSAIKAKEIMEIVQQTKKIEQNISPMHSYDRQFNERSAPNQHQSIQHPLIKKNTEKICSNILDKEASKAQKVTKSFQPHTTQYAKAMTL
ncbi:BID domain-containing T4SS effector [Bartonella queenslandensis]|uniref:BID domain-containing T4SS effector n=1 Tax=Bartonella queenslandensis TaxID=481138 RepID=UPI0003165BE5|nr:BID domain-containing T4SS effector [Bartonella queenslandensis]